MGINPFQPGQIPTFKGIFGTSSLRQVYRRGLREIYQSGTKHTPESWCRHIQLTCCHRPGDLVFVSYLLQWRIVKEIHVRREFISFVETTDGDFVYDFQAVLTGAWEIPEPEKLSQWRQTVLSRLK